MARRSGFTLLELMLSLSLTVIVLIAIGMAIDLHLRILDQRRGEIEQAQLARAVLGIMSNDLRNAVGFVKVDSSMVGDVLGGDALDSLGSELDVEGLQMGGSGGDSGNSGRGQGLDLMGDMESADLESMLEEEPTDIATTAAPSSVIGIYGNSYQLQVDVSRLPRVDQYNQLLGAGDPLAIRDIPSDVKTVAYYLAPETTEVDDPTVDTTEPVEAPLISGFGYGRGLVRRELDRAVTNWSLENGDTQRLQDSGEIIAPEIVGIQFRYFDGTTWQQEWDSQTMERLPMAVEVTILLNSLDGTPAAELMLEESMIDPNSASFYRVVVPILVAEPPTDEDAQLEEELGFE